MMLIWILIGLIYGYFKFDIIENIAAGNRDFDDVEGIILLIVMFPIFGIVTLCYLIREWWVNE